MAMDKRRQRADSHGTQIQAAPYFDKALFELWVNGVLVKRLDARAANQITILTAFQEENWPSRIDSPLHPQGGDEKSRLRDTIYSLNGKQHVRLIRFFADGSGQGIRWEPVSPPVATPRPRKKK